MSVFDKKTTVTDLQIIDLLEKDYAVRQAKFTSWYQSGGDMGVFNESYWWWKKSFRGFYSEKYLVRSGFLPSTDSERVELSDPDLLIHLQSVNPDITSATSAGKRVPSADDVARFYLQSSGHSYSNYYDILIDGINTYRHMSAIFVVDTTNAQVEITFSDGFYLDGGSEVPVADLVLTITNNFANLQSLVARVEYGSSPAPQWYVYLESWATVPSDISTSQSLIMTAIIPIKEDNVFSKEDVFMKRFLNKMGLGGRQLVDSLTETEDGDPSPVDNAYIMEGLPFDSTNQSVIATLFNSFKYIAEGAGSTIFLNMSSLNMTYEFNVSIVDIAGDMTEGVDNKGRPIYAVSEIIEGADPGDDPYYDPGPNSSLVIKYQTEPGTYKEMTVSNYVQRYDIISGGKVFSFTSYLTSDSEIGRLIVPLEVLNDLKFKDYVPVHEHAFCMVAYAIETTTIKWYQRIAGFVIGIVLGVLFGPAGMTLYQLIINAVINAVIALAISFVLAAIDNPWISAIVGVVMAIYGQIGSLDLSALTMENFLPLANKIIDGASGIYADYIKEEMEKVAKEAEEQSKEDQEKLDSMKPGVDIAKVLRDTMFSFQEATNASIWVESQLGDNMFDFDQYYDIQGEVESRKQVVSG